MGVISTYRIKDNDLYFTEHMYWTFEPNQEDAIREWHLKNVDKADIDKNKLDSLASYEEEAEFDQKKIGNRIQLSIFTYYDHSEYYFTCDSISLTNRPYNIDELTEIIIHNKKFSETQNETITKHRALLEELTKFLDNEIDRKTKIIEQVLDKTNLSVIKSKNQLTVLGQIKNILTKSNSI